jgi:hypothetical protein
MALSIDVDVIDLRDYVASTVGRTRRLWRALAPVDVVGALQPAQEIEPQLLEVRLIDAIEGEPIHTTESKSPCVSSNRIMRTIHSASRESTIPAWAGRNPRSSRAPVATRVSESSSHEFVSSASKDTQQGRGGEHQPARGVLVDAVETAALPWDSSVARVRRPERLFSL